MKLCKTCNKNPRAKWRTICKDCRNKQKREYRKTELGQTTTKRYNSSDARKQSSKRYTQSKKGKETIKKWQKEYCQRDYVKEKVRKYNSAPKAMERRIAWNKSEKGKAAFKRAYERKRNNPEHKRKVKAQNTIRTEIQSGRIQKASTFMCANCDNQAQSYHHYNGYDKKYILDVIPLCRSCHYHANRGLIDIAI